MDTARIRQFIGTKTIISEVIISEYRGNPLENIDEYLDYLTRLIHADTERMEAFLKIEDERVRAVHVMKCWQGPQWYDKKPRIWKKVQQLEE